MRVGVDEPRHERDVAKIAGSVRRTSATNSRDAIARDLNPAVTNGGLVDRKDPSCAKRPRRSFFDDHEEKTSEALSLSPGLAAFRAPRLVRGEVGAFAGRTVGAGHRELEHARHVAFAKYGTAEDVVVHVAAHRHEARA